MKKRFVKWTALLTCGGVVLQFIGCSSAAGTILFQQLLSGAISRILADLIRGAVETGA